MDARGFCYAPIKLPRGTYKFHVRSGVQITGRVGQDCCKVFISAKLIIDNVGVLQFFIAMGQVILPPTRMKQFLTHSRMFKIFSY